jgi:hypothetical protein
MDTLGRVLFVLGFGSACGVLFVAVASGVRTLLKQRTIRRYEEEIALLEEAKEALAEARACVTYADALTGGNALDAIQDLYEDRMHDVELELLWERPAFGGDDR